MNNYIHYGITYLTGYAIIKLRCKLTQTIATDLKEAYPSMNINYNEHTGYTYIEGILPSDIYDNCFMADRKIAMLMSKKQAIEDKLTSLHEHKAYCLREATLSTL